jgi:hypothetical protein
MSDLWPERKGLMIGMGGLAMVIGTTWFNHLVMKRKIVEGTII